MPAHLALVVLFTKVLGCRSSVLVTPVNPETGGTSVDGNWELAAPYPSAAFNSPQPNPCLLATSYGPAWVDQPFSTWLNPVDGLSQWISPKVQGPVDPGGWYIYRTAFHVPSGACAYSLKVTGQILADDEISSVYLEDGDGGGACRIVDVFNIIGEEDAWVPFGFTTTVVPSVQAHLYFVDYNVNQSYGNPTGIRVEFTDVQLTPLE